MGQRADPELDRLRADFPMLQTQLEGHPLIYLDTAATALKSRQVIEAMSRTIEQYARHHQSNRPDCGVGSRGGRLARCRWCSGRWPYASGCAGAGLRFLRILRPQDGWTAWDWRALWPRGAVGAAATNPRGR